MDSDEPLKQIKVRDSKKLSAKKREELAEKIRSIARVEVVEISAEEIDAMREDITMNELEARIFATILERLQPTEAYLDAADVDEDNFEKMVRSHTCCSARIFSRHKADDTFPVVSAASIVAKVVRDSRIREIEKELGESIGSGYSHDPRTIAFIERWVRRNGSCPPHTRRSWDTAQNIMTMNSLRRLDTFEG